MTRINEYFHGWNARESVQQEVESCGYMAHRIYQDLIFKLCSEIELKTDGLVLCWNEVAREWVDSCGTVKSVTRSFPDGESYRSSFLDDLASLRRLEGASEFFPLHKAERVFAQKILENPSYGLSISSQFKEATSSYKSIISDESELSAEKILKHIEIGIIEFPTIRVRRGVKIMIKDNFSLILGLDAQKSKLSYQLPFYISVSCGGGDVFHLGDLSKLIPGYRYITLASTAGEQSYAIDFHIGLVNAFIKTIV